MVIQCPTPRGVGKAANPDLPIEAMTAALCATDVWIEFNHQWLLYSTPFERASEVNRKLRYMCLVDFNEEPNFFEHRQYGSVNFSIFKRQ